MMVFLHFSYGLRLKARFLSMAEGMGWGGACNVLKRRVARTKTSGNQLHRWVEAN